ncbi:SusC/RagA family TonB-linked outer membrane protein [Sediminibacterium roseum]|uniref:SusC/RagA family TonB-linked outer membrane protein n=1 Tax=Sediminibacterium roseum TaxID=1978412 RepID=A0ABW9ZQK7_9BACT|nr:SusC/RagA family TonB-linked outer membrane protein [Sediminibacterium roseum]NCI49383.1 SusC/RagA family TonB-linked outer membrane protein [Sediminibacterium roseum]
MRKIVSSLLLTMLCFVIAGKAQTLAVSGRVTDEKGAPIPSASVVIKSKKTAGTAANSDGFYRINASRGDVLVISSVGYTTKEVTVSGTTANVSLVLSDPSLAEVVVTALGIKRSEKSLGYAVTSIKSDAVLQKSEPNLLSALAGKVPGLDIRAGQGAPGAAARMQIRGVTSFSGGEPLIVVDGLPYSNDVVNTSNPFTAGGTYGSGIGNIDPNDIESINVLKGAAASALYGSRAANGVIMIVTKSGAPKKGAKSLNVTYKAGYSIEKVADIPEFQNTYGAGANFRVQASNGSWGARFGLGNVYNTTGDVIAKTTSGVDSIPGSTWASMVAAYPELFPGGKIAYKAYPDNVKNLFKTGNLMEHSVSMNGGEGNSLFNMTLSRVDQNGYITNSNYSKNSISVGGQTAVGKLTIGGTMSYTRSKQLGGFIGAAQSFVSQWGRTYTMARNWDIVGFPSETRAGRQIGFNDGQYTNPVWGAYHNTITSYEDRLVASFRASYRFSSTFTINYNAGVNSYALFRDQIIDKSSYGGSDNDLGNITEQVYRRQELQSTLVAIYTPKISNIFTLDVKVGNDINSRTTRNQTVQGVNFVIPGLYTLTNTTVQRLNSDSRSNRRIVGFFADATLGYKNYAFLNATARTDITSTLPYKNAAYFYPAVSGTLIFTDALKMKSNWLDYGKLRAGFARVGKDADPQNGEALFNLSATGFLGQPYSTKDGTAYDPNLTPEFTREFEIGTEFRMFKGRVGFEVTWYDKRSSKLIYGVSVPVTTGYTTTYTNIGGIKNEGIEAALDLKPVASKDFQWTVRAIFTKNKNIVTELTQGITRFQVGGYNWAEPGMPYGYLRGSFTARTDDGQVLIHPTSGMPLNEPNEGIVGDPTPDFKLGLTNTFNWKGLQLNVLWDWSQGGRFYSETISGMLGRGVTMDTYDRETSRVIVGVYANPNQVIGADGKAHYVPLTSGGKFIPNQTRVTTNDLFFTQGTGASFATNGSFEYSVFDGTVYRLREVSLGYSLPQNIVRKLKLTNVTLSLSGRNLWFLAPNLPKFTHFDPDINSTTSANAQGVETGGAPSTKRYGINLNVTF